MPGPRIAGMKRFLFRHLPFVVAVIALTLAMSAPPGDAAAQEANAVPNFSGFWVRPEGGNARMFYPPETGPGPLINTDTSGAFTIGNSDSPILQRQAAEAVRAHGDAGRAGEVIYPAWSMCWPPAIPLILNMAEPVQLLQQGDRVVILYQRGNQYRQVDLNAKHPDNPAPSWNGHSVGHYEGTDTLVIDTIAQDTRSLVDRFGTPKSAGLRVVERYTISEDGSELTVSFYVEDPEIFTTGWSAYMKYVRPSSRPGFDPGPYNRDGEAIGEMICPENNRDAAGGIFPVPYDESDHF